MWYSPESNFIGIAHDIDLENEFENYLFKIISPSPRGHYVKSF